VFIGIPTISIGLKPAIFNPKTLQNALFSLQSKPKCNVFGPFCNVFEPNCNVFDPLCSVFGPNCNVFGPLCNVFKPDCNVFGPMFRRTWDDSGTATVTIDY
jgi:hypothetical protein